MQPLNRVIVYITFESGDSRDLPKKKKNQLDYHNRSQQQPQSLFLFQYQGDELFLFTHTVCILFFYI